MPLAYSDQLRDALLVLSRDRLSEIAARLRVEIPDRRSASAHAESIARAEGLTIGDILAEAKRSELKSICDKLGVDASGKEKGSILARIAAALGEKTDALTLTAPEPRPSKPSKTKRQKSDSEDHANGNGNGISDYRHPEATRRNNPPAGLIEFDKPPPQPTKRYAYDVTHQRHRDDALARAAQPLPFREVARAWQVERFSANRTRGGAWLLRGHHVLGWQHGPVLTASTGARSTPGG